MILGIIFLLVQTILAFSKPKYFLVGYLSYITSFFGFIPKDIIINGTEIGLFYQNWLMLSGFLLLIKRLDNINITIRILILGIPLYYLFGTLYPVLNGSSSLKQSIIASKEFSSFFLISYLFIHKDDLSYIFFERIMKFLGYFFLLVLLIFIFFKYIPPEYVKYPGQIEYNYPTLLSLFLFMEASKSNGLFHTIKMCFLLLIWGVGMYYEGHMAITLTTLAGCIILILRIPLIYYNSKLKSMIVIFIMISTFLLILPLNHYIINVTESNSIRSRIKYNIQRRELINSKPFLGYGFMHRSALNIDDSSKYTESLSFIDSGYIDLLGKFGIIGTSLFMIILIVPFLIATSISQGFAIKLFFFQLFFVNITWAVFSFSMGIISLSIALFILYKLIEEEKINYYEYDF